MRDGDIIDAIASAEPLGRIIGGLMLTGAALLMIACIYAAALFRNAPPSDDD